MNQDRTTRKSPASPRPLRPQGPTPLRGTAQVVPVADRGKGLQSRSVARPSKTDALYRSSRVFGNAAYHPNDAGTPYI